MGRAGSIRERTPYRNRKGWIQDAIRSPGRCTKGGGIRSGTSKNVGHLRKYPGEVFGYFAHSHPFLEGNGRTILTIYAELCRRGGFHIEWEAIGKAPFLQALTDELLKPGSSMDEFLSPYIRAGTLSVKREAVQLKSNFNRETEGQ